MKAISLSARRASKRIALNLQPAITAATIVLTVATIAAAVWQTDFFMYFCGTLALMGVYALDMSDTKGGAR